MAVRGRARRPDHRPARGVLRLEGVRGGDQDGALSRPRATTAAAAFALVLGSAEPAQAHGLVQRADLPIPEWLFAWGAAAVLVISFGALAVLWTRPKLEQARWRPLPGVAGRVLGGRVVELAGGAGGMAVLAVAVWAGYAGPASGQANLAPTLILVIVWVGFVFASVLLGDVFKLVNPWRAMGRTTGWLVARLRRGRAPGHAPYPARLGHWPAAAGLLGFTWIELASTWSDEPRRLVTATLAYTALTLAAMARYGTETWSRNGEAFGVYFRLISRMSVFAARGRVVGLRAPLSGLAKLEPRPGTVALAAVMIGSVTFDGLSQGSFWRTLSVDVNDALISLGLAPERAPQVTDTLGLLSGVALVALFYALGIAGVRSAGGALGARELRSRFVHTLVPIAAVYAAAHYLTFLLYQGQAIAYLASDPIGRGWDVFGTASSSIDYGVISQSAAWYAQVALVIGGHVAGLVLAHDRALGIHGQARLAARTQYWMLAVMVGFTVLALWLLAQANA